MIAAFQETLRTLHGASGERCGGVLRRISPVPKVVCCAGFLVLTVSFGGYDWRGCALFAVLPFAAARIGRIPVRPLLKRCCSALPFVLCAGIANCFFDRAPVEIWPGAQCTGGTVSLFVLFAKTLATVGAVLTLTACTPMNEISGALVRLKTPCMLVLILQLLFRYLLVMVGEAKNMTTAYLLRNPGRRMVPLRDWGALVGSLFLRTVARADAVYRAMQCRLFHAGNPLPAASGGSPREWGGAAAAGVALTALRWLL